MLGNHVRRHLWVLHKLLHRRFPEPPEMHQNGCITPILHNNIRKVGSFRNRQAASSTLALGSKICWVQPDLVVRKDSIRLPCDSVPTAARSRQTYLRPRLQSRGSMVLGGLHHEYRWERIAA